MAKMLGFLMLISLLMGVVTLTFEGAQGGVSTTLTAALTATGTTATVASTTGFKSAGRIIVGNEIMTYTGRTATTFTGLSRGVAGTRVDAYASGNRVYDEVLGYANLGQQYQTLQVQNEVEQAGRITLNPLSWGATVERLIVANQTFLTGDWQIVMLPWYAFTITFLFGLALAMAGLIRTVFLRG